MSEQIQSPDSATVTKPRTTRENAPRLLPPYHVVLHNDDVHTFEFVLGVLCKVLGCDLPTSFRLTEEAHTRGRAIIWTGPKEVAELKAEQVVTFHEVHPLSGTKLGPLMCTIEPAPAG